MPLSDSLSNLYKQTTKPVLKEAVYEIANDIDAGFSLSQALERHRGIFSEFYVNMVKSAEVTGRLSEVLDFLADYLEKQAALVSKVKKCSDLSGFCHRTFHSRGHCDGHDGFPQITPIFFPGQYRIAVFTKILLGVGNFMSDWWFFFVIAIMAVVILLVDYFQTNEGKVVLDTLILKVPIMGPLFQKLYISRFAESAGF